jgi:hypothetical protein
MWQLAVSCNPSSLKPILYLVSQIAVSLKELRMAVMGWLEVADNALHFNLFCQYIGYH